MQEKDQAKESTHENLEMKDDPQQTVNDVSQDDFIEERMKHVRHQENHQQFESVEQNNPYTSFHPVSSPRKSKVVVGLLAFIVPGTGHFYLGLMEKGLMMMLLIILDIVGIVYLVENSFNIPLMVLLSLMIPVIYFYNIFDALQSTDRVNARLSGFYVSEEEHSQTDFQFDRSTKRGSFGWILIGVGLLIFILSTKPAWLMKLISMFGSYIGAIILIVAGVFLFVKETRK